MIIYKVTNKVTGQVYIGKTKNNIETRWKQHRGSIRNRHHYGKLKDAILEYGAKNFTVEQIDCAATNEEANEKEIYWIAFYNSTESGYNTAVGGKDSGAGKKVVNVETGKTYRSMVAAAKAVGHSPKSVQQAVKYGWRCAGYHWKLV